MNHRNGICVAFFYLSSAVTPPAVGVKVIKGEITEAVASWIYKFLSSRGLGVLRQSNELCRPRLDR